MRVTTMQGAIEFGLDDHGRLFWRAHYGDAGEWHRDDERSPMASHARRVLEAEADRSSDPNRVVATCPNCGAETFGDGIVARRLAARGALDESEGQ